MRKGPLRGDFLGRFPLRIAFSRDLLAGLWNGSTPQITSSLLGMCSWAGACVLSSSELGDSLVPRVWHLARGAKTGLFALREEYRWLLTHGLIKGLGAEPFLRAGSALP